MLFTRYFTAVKLVCGSGTEQRKQEVQGYLVKISCNLHMYARQVSTRNQIAFGDRISSGNKYLKDCHIIFSPSFLDVNGANSYQQLSGRPISIGQVLRAVEHLCGQFLKLHSLLAEEENCHSQMRSSGEDISQEVPTIVSSLNQNQSTATNSNISHLVRLTGASIESTLWISWRHLDQFCQYGNAVEKSNGFPGMTMFYTHQ